MNTRNAEIRQLAKDITDFFRNVDDEILFEFSKDELFEIMLTDLRKQDMRKEIIYEILQRENSLTSSSLVERITLLK